MGCSNACQRFNVETTFSLSSVMMTVSTGTVTPSADLIKMPSCPFCQISISENLSLYGGHCPSCLIEIPGEEAVTNPGVAHASETTQVAESSSSPLLSVLVAAAVVLGGAGAWWVTREAPSEAPVVAVTEGLQPIPLSEHEDAEFEEEEAPVADAGPKAKRQVTRHVATTKRAPALAEPVADASVVPVAKGAGLGAAPKDVFGTIGAAPRSRAPASIVLDDSLKIEEMIGRVLNRGARQLEQCYNQALKLNPGVKGAWYVDFTITKDGKPVTVSVEPLEAAHREIESCIHRNVSRWRFQRISEPVDVARRYRFGG